MANVGKPPVAPPRRKLITSAVNIATASPETFVNDRTLKPALSALQRGPIHFRRNNVIAFYLPGDLFGWDNQKCTLSVEAATDAMVLFIKRSGLLSLAARESRVSGFLLAIATDELRRAQEHGLLMSRSAKCR